jgi:hypothetical protein
MVSVIESSCGTSLVTSIRFAQLAMAGQVMTCSASVTLTPITVAADIEKLAASVGMARSWTQDEFQRPAVPSRRQDSITAPVPAVGFFSPPS